MKIKNLKLHNVGGIPFLSLENLNQNCNLICGENGVGKTNILDSIASLYSSFNNNILLSRSGCDSGNIEAEIMFSEEGEENKSISMSITKRKPDNSSWVGCELSDYDKKLIYLKVNRVFEYQEQNSIEADPKNITGERNLSGLKNEKLKSWFINRYLHSAHEGNLTNTQKENFKLAVDCFAKLNSDYSFKKTTTENEIIVSSPTGDIYFEYLSSGFKSIIFILLGIIRELEFRFNHDNNAILAKDFDGIILIDEVELHLHPEWQGRIISILKETFPKVQFFITTHSPHVVQTAEKDEVIALQRIQENNITRRELLNSKYGYQGWTIEEILEDIMGMPTLRTDLYMNLKQKFDKALDEKNKNLAESAYADLNEMLHPDFPLRPILKLQLDTLLDN
jgi:hypothetical protein